MKFFSDEEVAKALQELIDMGLVERCGLDKQGEQLYRLTDLGEQKAEQLGLTPLIPESLLN